MQVLTVPCPWRVCVRWAAAAGRARFVASVTGRGIGQAVSRVVRSSGRSAQLPMSFCWMCPFPSRVHFVGSAREPGSPGLLFGAGSWLLSRLRPRVRPLRGGREVGQPVDLRVEWEVSRVSVLRVGRAVPNVRSSEWLRGPPEVDPSGLADGVTLRRRSLDQVSNCAAFMWDSPPRLAVDLWNGLAAFGWRDQEANTDGTLKVVVIISWRPRRTVPAGGSDTSGLERGSRKPHLTTRSSWVRRCGLVPRHRIRSLGQVFGTRGARSSWVGRVTTRW